MSHPPDPDAAFVFTAEGARALDTELERLDLLELSLEAVGRGVACDLQTHFPTGRVLVLAGGGANGGDALVAARHLAAWGREVAVLALPSSHPLTLRARARLEALGGWAPAPLAELTPESLAAALPEADVVLDGLSGTGLRPPLRAPLLEVVQALNASGLPVLSIDLPSGLDADTAEAPEVSVRARRTVAPAGLKTALVFGPASARAGEVELLPLDLPDALLAAHASARRFTPLEAARALPVRERGDHKGTAGRVWIVGGHPGTAGAAALSGVGALKAGSGLVTVYSEAEVPLVLPELMTHHLPDLRALEGQAGRPDALALGMGLGPKAADLARMALAWQLPTVLDADALQPELAGAGHDAVVWTPHPGEAARLLGTETPEVTRDPIAAARALQARYGGAVVLKGGPSVVAAGDGVTVAVGGNPGMGTAGMGDLLSGVIASLLGQGLAAPLAARVGVTLHARAGDRAAQVHGYGLTASDVAGELGAAWLSLRAGL